MAGWGVVFGCLGRFACGHVLLLSEVPMAHMQVFPTGIHHKAVEANRVFALGPYSFAGAVLNTSLSIRCFNYIGNNFQIQLRIHLASPT